MISKKTKRLEEEKKDTDKSAVSTTKVEKTRGTKVQNNLQTKKIPIPTHHPVQVALIQVNRYLV